MKIKYFIDKYPTMTNREFFHFVKDFEETL
jgi:hypothetical protein